jgi:hypothetical protein
MNHFIFHFFSGTIALFLIATTSTLEKKKKKKKKKNIYTYGENTAKVQKKKKSLLFPR